MKTTIEVPDELMRRVKMLAIQRNQKLKDAVAQLLEAGMTVTPADARPERAPRPVRLKGRHRIDIDDIESAIASGRD